LFTQPTLSRIHRSRCGMTTVLGMLIFIGVLFTCVIPLFLYVNQVNSIYDRTIVEMRQFDEERGRELIDVYAYPLNKTSSELNIYMKNKCPLSVRIVRVWVNEDKFDRSFEIPAMGDRVESINVQDLLPPQGEKSFNIKVTTDRGNTFSSYTNPLYYTMGSGWSGSTGLTINIVIETRKSQATRFFYVEVKDSAENVVYKADIVKKSHESSCFTAAMLTSPGTYSVKVKEGMTEWPTNPNSVTVNQNQPSQWVYANAK